jgi:hypothetical protein
MAASPIPPAGHIPPAFLQILVELEQGVNGTITAEKSATKKMAPVKAKALNGLKQAIKKKTKEFEAILKIYNEVSLSVEWDPETDFGRTLLLTLPRTNGQTLFPPLQRHPRGSPSPSRTVRRRKRTSRRLERVERC